MLRVVRPGGNGVRSANSIPKSFGYRGVVAVLPLPEVEKAGAAGGCRGEGRQASGSAPSPCTNPDFSPGSGGCAALCRIKVRGGQRRGKKMNLPHPLFCTQRTSKALMEKPFYIFHQSSCSDLAGRFLIAKIFMNEAAVGHCFGRTAKKRSRPPW